MKHKQFIAVTALVLLFIGCARKIKVDLPPIYHPPFKSFTAPNTSYEPGYIFRVPTKGKTNDQIYVTSLNAKGFVHTSNIEFERQAQTWKYGTFFKFLAPADYGSATFDKNKTLNLTFSLDDCYLEQLPEEQIEKLLKDADLNLKSDSRYFVISETIKTKGMNFKLGDEVARDINFNTEIKKMEGEGKLSKHGNDSSFLAKRFDEPYRIMYHVIEFSSRGTMMGEGKSYYFTPADNIALIPTKAN